MPRNRRASENPDRSWCSSRASVADDDGVVERQSGANGDPVGLELAPQCSPPGGPIIAYRASIKTIEANQQTDALKQRQEGVERLIEQAADGSETDGEGSEGERPPDDPDEGILDLPRRGDPSEGDTKKVPGD